MDDIRVRGIGKSVIKEEETIAQCEGNPVAETVSTVYKQSVFLFDGKLNSL